MTFRKMPGGDLEYQAMTPGRIEEIRISLGMSRITFGELVGYTGEPRNIETTIKRLETGYREVPPMVERLLMLLLWFRDDHGHLPDLDAGERQPRAVISVPSNIPVRVE